MSLIWEFEHVIRSAPLEHISLTPPSDDGLASPTTTTTSSSTTVVDADSDSDSDPEDGDENRDDDNPPSDRSSTPLLSAEEEHLPPSDPSRPLSISLPSATPTTVVNKDGEDVEEPPPSESAASTPPDTPSEADGDSESIIDTSNASATASESSDPTDAERTRLDLIVEDVIAEESSSGQISVAAAVPSLEAYHKALPDWLASAAEHFATAFSGVDEGKVKQMWMTIEAILVSCLTSRLAPISSGSPERTGMISCQQKIVPLKSLGGRSGIDCWITLRASMMFLHTESKCDCGIQPSCLHGESKVSAATGR